MSLHDTYTRLAPTIGTPCDNSTLGWDGTRHGCQNRLDPSGFDLRHEPPFWSREELTSLHFCSETCRVDWNDK